MYVIEPILIANYSLKQYVDNVSIIRLLSYPFNST